MGGGGGGRTTERVTTSTPPGTASAPPQVLPELQPFVKRVGEVSAGALDLPQLNFARFAQDQALPVPQLSPLELAAREQIGQRGQFGIPVPAPQQLSFQQLQFLPQIAGQQVPISPFSFAGLQTSGDVANIAGQVNQPQQRGVAGQEMFLGSDFGNSPAVQAAVEGLQQEIVPAMQNQAALAGLAQSGFLPKQIGRAYARELVPLYAQGLQQQQKAASELFSQGTTLTNQQLQGLQQLRDTQSQLGQFDQARQTDALIRQTQAALGSAPQMFQLGAAEEARPIEAIKELMTFGELERSREGAQAQADLESFMRQREIAMGLANPFGSFNVVSGIPTQTTREGSTRQTGGFGLGKAILLPWLTGILYAAM